MVWSMIRDPAAIGLPDLDHRFEMGDPVIVGRRERRFGTDHEGCDEVDRRPVDGSAHGRWDAGGGERRSGVEQGAPTTHP
jgi:hypothetical protein